MENLAHAEASDEMQEIGNEETFAKAAVMWIDGATHFENLITVVGFIFIVALTISTGVTGSPAINSQRSVRPFKNTTHQVFSFDAAPISPYNRFLSFDITFTKKDVNKNVNIPVDFSWFVECTSQGKTVNKTKQSFHGNAISTPGVKDTQIFHLFNDQLINYQSVELKVEMDISNLESDFSGIAIIAKLGANDQTTFQCYFRFVYSCFEFFSMYQLIKKFRQNGVLNLHWEQKLMMPLIIAAVLSNDPFYILQTYYPNGFYFFFEALSTSVFECLIFVAVLTIFEIMRQKNVKIDLQFFIPKFIFCGIVAFSHLVYQLYLSFKAVTPLPVIENSSTEFALRMFEVILLTGFVIWAVTIFVQAVLTLDKTEAGKWIMYSFANLLLLVGVVYYNILATALSMYQDSAVLPVARFVFNNAFVLIMIYYHWPYETIQEQNYIEEGKPETPADFAEIADPMIVDGDNDFDKEKNEDEEEEEEEEEEE